MTVEQLEWCDRGHAEAALAATERLMAASPRRFDFAVDARLWISDPDATSLTWLHPDVGRAGTAGALLHPRLARYAAAATQKGHSPPDRPPCDALVLEHVPKYHYSAFHATELDAQLRANGIEEVYLAGIHTNFCVASTAMAAFERGWRCFVVEEACAAFGGEAAHKEGLAQVERYLGAASVVRMADVLLHVAE